MQGLHIQFIISVDIGNGKLHEQGEPESWRGDWIQNIIFVTGIYAYIKFMFLESPCPLVLVLFFLTK